MISGYPEMRLYLWGGIGNVLYQVNFALYLEYLGYNVELSSILLNESGPISQLNGHHKGTYLFLEKFNDNLEKPLKVKKDVEYRDILNFMLKFLSINAFQFKSFEHEVPHLQELRKLKFIIGYFQLVQWRSDLLSLAMASFVNGGFVNITRKEEPDDTSLVVHLRLGDKTNDKDYFLDMSLMEKVYKLYKKVYFVSDSPNEVDDYINSLCEMDCTFYNYCSDSVIKDFITLYRAKNIALSRSSFSWWAAELSPMSPLVYEPCPFYSHLNWTPFTVNLNKICYEKL
jgi:hypothetical protein